MNTVNTQHMIAFPDFVQPLELDASSESDGWYTPRWMIEAARMVLGTIDLDPATCAAAQAVVQATTWYTKTDDGLIQPWRKVDGTAARVWCNPPYSNVLPWAERLIDSYASGEIAAGMILVNCSCSPKWAQLLWKHADAVCLLQQRMNFWHPTKANAHGSYDRDSALFYIGSYVKRFREVFEQYGVVR